jgi:ATP-dependent Clp protease adaptor protein ClpS
MARGTAGRRRYNPDRMLRTPRAATKEQTETKSRPDTSLAQPWNVIVHDDPVTLMTYVTRVFVQVFGYAEHNKGRSVVWTGAREQAEVYAQKLQAHHLLTSLEQVTS